MLPNRITNKPSSSTSLSIVMLLFGFVAILAMVGPTSAECTPSTCPDVPVFAYFQHANCTGHVVYQPEEGATGVCSGNPHQIVEQTPEALVYTRFYDSNPTCDRTVANASYEMDIFVFGACRPETNVLIISRDGQATKAPPQWSSFMVLRNVNESYSPYEFHDRPLAGYSSAVHTCDSIDNCTMQNGEPAKIWRTIYDSTCQIADYSRVDKYEYADLCRNYYGLTYYKAGCWGENAMYEGWFTDAACTQPSQLLAINSPCTAGSQTTWHCTADPTPLPVLGGPINGNPSSGPQTPTSNAGVILPSSCLAFLLIALFVFTNAV